MKSKITNIYQKLQICKNKRNKTLHYATNHYWQKMYSKMPYNSYTKIMDIFKKEFFSWKYVGTDLSCP
jgi:hypothetical protein